MLAVPRAVACAALLAAAVCGSPAAAAPARNTTPSAATPPRAVVRADAAHAIALAEDERRWSDGVLASYLDYADPAVRQRAVLAVGRLQDSTTVAALLPRLDDPNLDVRREAVFALGQIGHRSARQALERQLQHPDAEMRQLALEALGKLGDRAATSQVARFLGDASPTLRGAAAVALWRLADSTALGALIARTEDADPGVRWRVLWALEKIVAPDPIVLRAALGLDEPDPLVRAYAARTIGRQKHPRGTAYVLGAMNDADVGVAVNAIRAVQQIADSACGGCAPALERMLTHAHPYARATAATALGDRFAWVRLDTAAVQRVRASLVARLRDSDAATRGAAAKALLARFGTGALAEVEPVLADSSVYARVAALDGLRGVVAPGGLGALLRPRLEPGRHMLERTTAAEVLGERHEPGASKLLRSGLADTSLLFVAACAGALASAGDSASVPLLIRTYAAHRSDGEPDARLGVLDGLRTLGRGSVADSLERATPARLRFASADSAVLGEPVSERVAVVHTDQGDIEWAFYTREAPQTVRNFARLARRGYFNGTAFHRVVPNFVVQDGDPTGTGSGGPGYSIRCEYNRLHYDPGQVGMALAGKDTGGSQWFITHSPQPHLDGRYTIFARVVRGMDVVQRITQGDRIVSIEVH